jgi:hypothetical protein
MEVGDVFCEDRFQYGRKFDARIGDSVAASTPRGFNCSPRDI